MKDTEQSATTAAADDQPARGFTDEERDAMRQHAQELRRARRRGSNAAREDGERDVLAKIAEMQDSDRIMAERIHAIVKAAAPDLWPRTWYGMPAYARDGNAVVCFFQPAQKFKTRYATFGFSDKANLDNGAMWPNSYALTELTATDEARIADLVKQAVS